MGNLIDLQADFTAEYTAMMDVMNPGSSGGNVPQGNKFMVDEEGYLRAINIQNIPFRALFSMTSNDGNGFEDTADVIFANGGMKGKEIISRISSYNAYVNASDGYHSFVSSDNGETWFETSSSWYTPEESYLRCVEKYTPYGFLGAKGVTFDKLTFDEATNMYKGQTEELSISLKFEDGQLTYLVADLQFVSGDDTITQHREIMFFYGNIDTTLPQVEIEGEQGGDLSSGNMSGDKVN